ncbi:PREDICTED: uncharacterized protein LOC106107048 [Papilio polytes]|uniref:uncharacterized protein LOC106107048 n=1 Tax=Papilio polytes TaxID=76194 RepID=UPI00067681F6|nr:PREDICTED: uncharacterized protein LOC106107048 [Papilio polytes]
MGEHIGTKDGEQYPLLKIDSGGSDGSNRGLPAPPCIITSGCHTTRTPKQSWMDRWPELISACWITFILIGISFLAFYTLGLNAYRRQPLIINKCNASKLTSTVTYHHIVPRGSYVSFLVYSDYISSIAQQYPLLHINVLFLMDDSSQTPIQGSRHTRLYNKLIQSTNNILDNFDQNNKEIRIIQKKYPNVNVTIMPLSKYMASTPHRYKWRTIPMNFLNFYVRVFTVWQYGGVAMDLSTYNDIFNMHHHPDRRISAILRQHNDGIESEKYVNALKKINEEEQKEFFAMFNLLIHHVLNETCSFFNRSLWYNNEAVPGLSLNKHAIRSQRNKRDSRVTYEGEMDLSNIALDISTTVKSSTTELEENVTNAFNSISNINANDTATPTFTTSTEPTSETYNTEQSTNFDNITKQSVTGIDKVNFTNTHGEILPNIILYDILILTDSNPNMPFQSDFTNLPKPINQFEINEIVTENLNIYDHQLTLPVLVISTDGTFVAAPTRRHPMLAYLLSFGCERVSPILAINRAMMSQCTGIFKNDMHCDNIYVL